MSANDSGQQRDGGVVLIGAGPANLAVAIALEEEAPDIPVTILDAASSKDRWHAGLQLPGAMMQIHALKDLATPRNPSSTFSVVSFLHETGNFYTFLNSGDTRLARSTFAEYLGWVERKLSARIMRNAAALSIEKTRADDYEVTYRHDGKLGKVRASSVCLALGGEPKAPPVASSQSALYAVDYLKYRDTLLPSTDSCRTIMVVGSGQTGVEVATDLLERYPRCKVCVVTPEVSILSSDQSPFVNEVFDADQWASFRRLPSNAKASILEALRVTNYGVANEVDIEHLYRLGRTNSPEPRLEVIGLSRVHAVTDDFVEGIGPEGPWRRKCDAVIWANGFDRSLNRPSVRQLLGRLGATEDSPVGAGADRAVTIGGAKQYGIYVLGAQEDEFGIGETLISSAALRAGELSADIIASARGGACQPGVRDRGARVSNYPRSAYSTSAQSRALEIVRRFPLAAVQCVGVDGRIIETDVPMAVRRVGDDVVELFGHLDALNPQGQLLDGPVRIVFRGPNAYISPSQLGSDSLPTWNFCKAVGQGVSARCSDEESLRSGLQLIAQTGLGSRGLFDTEPDADLASEDPRIERLLPHVQGFVVSISHWSVYAKMSQDLAPNEGVRAVNSVGDALLTQAEWVCSYNWDLESDG